EPVLTIPEMLNHPQTKARGMVTEVPKSDGSSQRQIASPYKFSRSEHKYQHIGTAAGVHNDEILAELGYTPATIATLRQQGVFG
ncbi:MAG: CoA transferase, partial [Chloroflexi bacterium]|nr:CoA transferase [Chloroflexota bacterium]